MKFITYLSILFIFFPKINLMGIHATSGLRIDDIFLFLIFIIVIGSIFTNLNKFNFILNINTFHYIFAITFVSFMAFLLNVENVNIYNLFYALRIFEYSLFIILGYYMYNYKINIEKIFIFYGIISSIIIFFQYAGFIGGFALGTYSPSVQSRPIGLTAGPWEVALLLIYATILVRFSPDSKYQKLFLNSIFFISITLTGSRIGTIAFLIVCIFLYKKRVLLILSILFFLFSVYISFFQSVPLLERSKALFNYNNIIILKEIYDNIDTNISFEDQYNQVDLSTTENDVSWLIRLNKWIYIIKKILLAPVKCVFGYSPGYFGSAVDGSYFRIFGEIGILGLIFYYLMFKSMIINYKIKLCLIGLFINMIFIDVVYSYKSMSFIFMLYGYYYNENMKYKRILYQ